MKLIYVNKLSKTRGGMEYSIMSESMRDEFLEKEFDFSKAIKNQYIKELKK